jgi:hypothetical protein
MLLSNIIKLNVLLLTVSLCIWHFCSEIVFEDFLWYVSIECFLELSTSFVYCLNIWSIFYISR